MPALVDRNLQIRSEFKVPIELSCRYATSLPHWVLSFILCPARSGFTLQYIELNAISSG